jgi:double-stranded uracil-DNA glycosylase
VCHAVTRVAAPASDSRPSGTVGAARSDVPDVLTPGLRCVFCGINPGRVSAQAHAHFANPRNDFWRLLYDAGFTPRLLDPTEQFELLDLGYGITNAAYRTTPGAGDLRRRDFDAQRLERLARELQPLAVAFVGKEAYRGSFGERPDLGPQLRTLGTTGLFVVPSTSPANAAVPYAERLEWFRALRDWIEPRPRETVRALIVDARDRVLLLRFENAATHEAWWATPGGGLEPGESDEQALRRELLEETGLAGFDPGPVVWVREHVLPWNRRLWRQRERFHLIRVASLEVAPTLDLRGEGVYGHRWWTLDELEATTERLGPRALATALRPLVEHGPPAQPVDLDRSV